MASDHAPGSDKTLRPRKRDQSQTRSDSAAEGAQSHPLTRLQRQVGNQQVQRMLAQRQAPEEDELQAKHDASLQRQAPEEDELLQAKHEAGPEVGLAGGPVSPELARRVEANRGSGSPLDSATRERMEGALGAPLKDVRVHTDAESAALNQRISAKAFTTGSDIFLGAGAAPSDSRLMAHELAHVVQQRSTKTSGPMAVGPADDHAEREADQVAAAVEAAPTPAQRKTEEQ
jgi:Domain of unknown function (DUF4157)